MGSPSGNLPAQATIQLKQKLILGIVLSSDPLSTRPPSCWSIAQGPVSKTMECAMSGVYSQSDRLAMFHAFEATCVAASMAPYLTRCRHNWHREDIPHGHAQHVTLLARSNSYFDRWSQSGEVGVLNSFDDWREASKWPSWSCQPCLMSFDQLPNLMLTQRGIFVMIRCVDPVRLTAISGAIWSNRSP